ncbi:hypothetical protein ACK3TF_006274 [Chlorella vulgaris]
MGGCCTHRIVFQHSMIAALSCAWQVSSKWGGSTQRPSGVVQRPSRPAGYARFSNNRRGWPARQIEQQRLAVIGANASSSDDSGSAAQHLLQLSQQYDSQAAGDRYFSIQLTAEERLARIEMLLQQGVTEETVQRMIENSKGGPYMQSASEGAAILAVLRERGCSDAEMNLLLRQSNIMARPGSSTSDVFVALDDMLQLSRVKIMQVCLQQPSLLKSDSGKLRQRWSWVQAHYGLSKKAVASLARRMVNNRNVCGLLTYSQATITVRLSGLQRLFELSDAEVSKLFPYLAELLEYEPEQHIRPRWDLYQSLLGEFDPADKRRFIMSPDTLRLPEPTIRDVFSGVEQLMGSTADAQSLLLRSPKSFACGIERLATNLRTLQQLYGCSSQQAQKVLVRTPLLTPLMLEAPKFQCRVAVLTQWYGHASPAALLLAPSCGARLCGSMWKLGARMAFIRRLRLERAEPELNTSNLASSTEQFCRAVRVSEEEYAAFEQRWLASPEAAELCRHEGPPHRLFELSDAEVSKLFPYLAELLEADPEQHIRPRWDLYQSLLGEFQPADKRRFMTSPGSLRLPEATIRSVFRGVEQLMGSTADAQSLLRLSPKSFGSGIERLATNLRTLQQLYGCSSQQAQKVLVRTPLLTPLMLEAPKFQCRVAALTQWYGHASPAALLLAPSCGARLCGSMWKLGARMAFIRRLRLERAEPELNTSNLASSTEQFCRAVRVSEEEYAAFEQRWLASPEAAELCRHEGPPHVKIIGAEGAEL